MRERGGKDKMSKKVTYAPNSRGLDTLEKKTLLKFVANGNVRKLMMRRCKCEKIDGNGNVRNLMAMEMKM